MGSFSHSLGSAFLGDLGGQGPARNARAASREDLSFALRQLDPKNLSKLMAMFYQHYMSQMNPQMQGAMQGLQANFGRSGMSQSGLGAQLKAGIPGQFALGANNQAMIAALQAAIQKGNWAMQRQSPQGQTFGQVVKDLGVAFLGGGGGGAIMGAACWIAEAIYGVDAPETHALRAYVNIYLPTKWWGRPIVAFYRRFGQRIAKSRLLCRLLKPLFDAALEQMAGFAEA